MNAISPANWKRIAAVIPALDAEDDLAATLHALAGAGEVIVVDGGSGDRTVDIAASHGARIVRTPPGRGRQLHSGALSSRSDWLFFIHADTVIDQSGRMAIASYIEAPGASTRAAALTLRLDAAAWQARLIERLVALRVALLALPYGDQGLLIHRSLYDQVGGYRAMPLMEDVDLVRRLGRKRLISLDADIVTSAKRWQRNGWARQAMRNLTCLTLFLLGTAPERIAPLYDRPIP